MPVIEAHFFAPDDLNGSTIFECSSDDRFVKNIQLDIQRDKLGSGKIEFARRVPAGGLFTREIVVPEVFVRYLIPSIDATHYIWGNFIGPRQQQVVSKSEAGGEGFTFGGPGPKFYLTRMILWSASFSGQDAAVDRDGGVWTWPESASAGRIMARLIEEETDNPHGPFLPDLTASFGDVNDSDGVPWTDDVSGTEDFTLNIQDDYLKILWQLENAGELISMMNLGTVSNPLMQLGMYQSFGRDLTGAIAADTVHFTEGVNIRNDLDVEGESLKKGTHALVRGAEGIYHFVASPDFVPGEYKKVLPVDYTSSANTNTLDRAGKRYLRRQRIQEHGIELRIVPGFDPASGLYMPGADGTDGHFWISDTVDLTTGISPNDTELDYQSEAQLVTGIELELAKAVKDGSDLEAARSFDITVHLNQDRTSDSTTPSRQGGGSSAGSANCNCLRLCRASSGGEVVTGKLYYTANTDVTSGLDGTDYSPSWDVADGGISAPERLRITPQDTYSNAGSSHLSNSSVGLPAETMVLGMFSFPLSDSADILGAVQNGAVWRTVIRSRNRFGIGVDDGAQENYPDWTIRVYRPGTGFIGTLFDVGDGTAAYIFYAGAAYPSIPMEAAGAAVPSAVGSDYLVVDLGADHVAPTSGATGFGYRFSDQAALADLPFIVDSQADQNSWLEASYTADAATPGAGNVALIGTSHFAKHCDDTEHFPSDREPTVNDDVTQGMRLGTLWLDTTTGRVWWLTDNTEAAAVWVLVSDPTPSSGGSSLTIQEEDGSPAGIFDTLKVSDGRLTDNGDGSASLDVETVGAHAHEPPTAGVHKILIQRTTNFSTANNNNSMPDYDTVIEDTMTDSWFDVGNPDRLVVTADYDGLDAIFTAKGALADPGSSDYLEAKLYLFPASYGEPRPLLDVSGEEDHLLMVDQQHADDNVNQFDVATSDPVTVHTGDVILCAWRTSTAQTLIPYNGRVGITLGAYILGASGGGSSVEELDDLSDVVITAPAEDDDLRYDGAAWVNDPRKWEAVTDGEDVFVWESDDLVHEWNEAP